MSTAADAGEADDVGKVATVTQATITWQQHLAKDADQEQDRPPVVLRPRIEPKDQANDDSSLEEGNSHSPPTEPSSRDNGSEAEKEQNTGASTAKAPAGHITLNRPQHTSKVKLQREQEEQQECRIAAVSEGDEEQDAEIDRGPSPEFAIPSPEQSNGGAHDGNGLEKEMLHELEEYLSATGVQANNGTNLQGWAAGLVTQYITKTWKGGIAPYLAISVSAGRRHLGQLCMGGPRRTVQMRRMAYHDQQEVTPRGTALCGAFGQLGHLEWGTTPTYNVRVLESGQTIAPLVAFGNHQQGPPGGKRG